MNRKLAAIMIGVLVIGGGVYSYATRVAFRNPTHCTTCHAMVPFYKNWQTSTHNMVPCLKCHQYSAERAMAEQFMFVTGMAKRRPPSNIPDKNCLQKGCHDERLVASKVTFTKRGITFDHRPHFTETMREIELHCRSCHSNIVQGDHTRTSKYVCFLCHFKGVPHDQAATGCPSCHSAPKKPIMVRGRSFSHDAVLKAGYKYYTCHIETSSGDGITPKDKCAFCHADRKEQYSDVRLIHEKHVTQKQINCLKCHPKIEHGNIKMADKIPMLFK
jgi:hypothetical protein